MRKLILLLLFVFVSCVNAPVEDGYRLVPNPYSPQKDGFLDIYNKDGTNPVAGQYRVRVFNYNLKLIYEETLTADGSKPVQYSGISTAGSKLAPGLYFVQVISMIGSTETTESSYTNLLVK